MLVGLYLTMTFAGWVLAGGSLAVSIDLSATVVPAGDDDYFLVVDDDTFANGLVEDENSYICEADANISNWDSGTYGDPNCFWYIASISYAGAADLTPGDIYDCNENDPLQTDASGSGPGFIVTMDPDAGLTSCAYGMFNYPGYYNINVGLVVGDSFQVESGQFLGGNKQKTAEPKMVLVKAGSYVYNDTIWSDYGKGDVKYGKWEVIFNAIYNRYDLDNMAQVHTKVRFTPDPNTTTSTDIEWIQIVSCTNGKGENIINPTWLDRCLYNPWELDRKFGFQCAWYGMEDDGSLDKETGPTHHCFSKILSPRRISSRNSGSKAAANCFLAMLILAGCACSSDRLRRRIKATFSAA